MAYVIIQESTTDSIKCGTAKNMATKKGHQMKKHLLIGSLLMAATYAKAQSEFDTLKMLDLQTEPNKTEMVAKFNIQIDSSCHATDAFAFYGTVRIGDDDGVEVDHRYEHTNRYFVECDDKSKFIVMTQPNNNPEKKEQDIQSFIGEARFKTHKNELIHSISYRFNESYQKLIITDISDPVEAETLAKQYSQLITWPITK